MVSQKKKLPRRRFGDSAGNSENMMGVVFGVPCTHGGRLLTDKGYSLEKPRRLYGMPFSMPPLSSSFSLRPATLGNIILLLILLKISSSSFSNVSLAVYPELWAYPRAVGSVVCSSATRSSLGSNLNR